MENKKDFKILCVGEGNKKMEYNPILFVFTKFKLDKTF